LGVNDKRQNLACRLEKAQKLHRHAKRRPPPLGLILLSLWQRIYLSIEHKNLVDYGIKSFMCKVIFRESEISRFLLLFVREYAERRKTAIGAFVER